MLESSAPKASVIVCSTCRHSADAKEAPDGRRGGAHMFDAMQSALAEHPHGDRISVHAMACLWACSRFSTVHLRAPGKMSYVLGGFSPTLEDARAILDYAARYAESADGIVPFADWPEGVKGHFITRSPPEGFVPG